MEDKTKSNKNKQNTHTSKQQPDDRISVTREAGGWRRVKRVRGSNERSQRETRPLVVSTQWSVQMSVIKL